VTRLDQLWAGWRSEYITDVATKPEPDACFLCDVQALRDEEALILERTDATFTLMNAYPYTSGHVLIAPRRHTPTLVDLDAAEAGDLMGAVQRANAALVAAYTPDGLNVGANIGRAAGAGLPGHVHLHAMPRWSGDTNFMTAVADTRVLPESLRASYDRLRAAWDR
jgi:ATP adenylyltransferase